MKATSQIDSVVLLDSDRKVMPAAPAPVTDYSYQQRRGVPAKPVAAAAKQDVPQLPFRTLTLQVLGAEASREFLREGIVFALVTLVAAWPLGMTIDLLANIIW